MRSIPAADGVKIPHGYWSIQIGSCISTDPGSLFRKVLCLTMSESLASVQQRFLSLSLSLPPAPKPIGAYTPSLILGSFLYVSGHLPILSDGTLLRGRVGSDLDADAGKQAARHVGLTILATLLATAGSLDRVRRVVKVFGMVNCTPEFEQHPHVLNGCSELFAEIWGREMGIGVRSAVGVASLPNGVPVEIEALFELV